MLSDTNKSIMLSVITVCHYADSHCAEYHYDKCRGALNMTTKTGMALSQNTTRQHCVKSTSLLNKNNFFLKRSSLLSFFIIFIFFEHVAYCHYYIKIRIENRECSITTKL